jgi:hypothetical protein
MLDHYVFYHTKSTQVVTCWGIEFINTSKFRADIGKLEAAFEPIVILVSFVVDMAMGEDCFL